MARAIQNNVLMEILADNRNTDYGRRYGFEKIKTAGQFRNTLPVSSYDDYAPLIALMARLGERNIITSDKLVCYLLSFGHDGSARFIPCTDRYINLYNESNGMEALGRIPAPGHIFFLNPAYPRLKRFNDGLYLNPVSGPLLAKYAEGIFGERTRGNIFTCPRELIYGGGMFDHRYIRLLFALSDENVSLIAAPYSELITDSFLFLEDNWEMLADDIQAGAIGRHDNLPKEFWIPEDIKTGLAGTLKPNPKRASELRAVFREGFERPVAHRIWPRLEFILTQNSGSDEENAGKINGSEQLKRYAGSIPMLNAPYFSAEALIGESVTGSLNEYVLLPHAGFFEFAPVSDGILDKENTLLMYELSVGGEYGIIITNCLGFYRYYNNDVVRVLRMENNVPVVGIIRRSGAGMSFSDINEKECLLRTGERGFSVTKARF